MQVTTSIPGGDSILSAKPEEIDGFETEVGRFRAGEWDANEYMGFRVKQGVYGQRQADEQMMRVKLPLGVATAEQFEALGRVAERYAPLRRGHLTTRENVQFHFLKLEDTPAIMRELGEVGLTTREACGNTVRNVVGAPLAGVCPREAFDVTPYATVYARHFLRNPLTQALPRKFKSSWSCCDDDDAVTGIQDLGFIPRVRVVDGVARRGFQVMVGGGTSIYQRTALELYEFTPVEDYLRVAEAILRVFNDCDELRKNRMRARLKFHIHKVGIDVFRSEVEAELAGDWPSGRVPAELLEPHQPAADGPAPDAFVPARFEPNGHGQRYGMWLESNVFRQRQPGYAAAVIRVNGGNLAPEQFYALAGIAREFARGELRSSVQQNLVLRWIEEARLPQLYEALDALGLSGAANTLSDVTSCPGTDSCKLGITASNQLRAALSESLRGIEEDDPLVREIHVKISGCPHGCGQHHVADIGLEGAATKRGTVTAPCYHLYLGGSYTGGGIGTGADQTAIGARPGIRITARSAPEAVERLITTYQTHRLEGERFREFVNRSGGEFFKNVLEDLLEPPAFGPDTVPFFQDWGREGLFKVERGEGECAV